MAALIGEDQEVLDLLRSQRAPRGWAVYRVTKFRRHVYEPISNTDATCATCEMSLDAHLRGHIMRRLIILTNGPVRNLVVLTKDALDLPRPARFWLNTLFNLSEAVGSHIDDWVAYDGKG